jgi:Spy/CpxP family protein refolding chaperone
MNFKYLLVPILAVIGCGALQAQSADTTPSSSPGNEQHHHWRHHHHHAWIWKKLNLTDDQKGQIKSIRQTMKSQTRPALVAVLTAKLKLHQDIAANSVNTNDVSALVSAESQLATLRAQVLGQIKNVLTADQQTMLTDFQQKREARMQNLINKLSQPTS